MLLFFAPYGAMYQLFFNASYQAKAIAIGLSKAYPLAELVDCSTPLRFTNIGSCFCALYIQRKSSRSTFT